MSENRSSSGLAAVLARRKEPTMKETKGKAKKAQDPKPNASQPSLKGDLAPAAKAKK